MNLSELINEILSEWAYRCDDGMPNPKNPIHLKELGVVLSEMGLSHIKNALVENLLMEKGKTPERVKEAEGSFSNPILNKKIKYKNTKGEDAEGIVGNLLRLPAEHPGRKAAEALLPADGSPERDSVNQDLGGQGKPAGADKPKDDKGGEKPAGGGEEEKAKAAQAMFDPKTDPAMAARMDTEKDVHAKLAKDAEADKEAEKEQEPKSNNKPEVEFSEPTNPPPQNEKGVEKDGKIAGTTIETEPKLSEVDPKFLKEKSTEMNKYYEDFKEDKKKSEAEAMAKLGYTPEQVKDLKDDAKKEFEDEVKKNQQPTYNLCKVSVPNSNLFCAGNKGIPRAKMPQFKGEPVEGTQAWDVLQKAKEKDPTATEAEGEPYFRQMLADKGIKVTDADVPSESLKATQSELVGDKVLGMKSVLDAGPSHPAYKKMTSPLFVSRDGYVVDGHHRWAAITAYNMEHPDNPLPLKTMIIDQDIDEAIETSNTFANEFGVAAKSGKQTGADAQKQAEPPMDEPSRPDTTPVKDKSQSKEETTKVANDLKGRTTSEGDELDVDTTDNGSLIIGVEHGADKESNKQAIEQIKKLPKDTKVMFVGEGGSKDDDGNIEFGGEQDEFRNSVKGHFDNAEESTWDENADVMDDTSPVYDEVAKSVGGSKSKSKAAVWSNMYGQDGKKSGMLPEDYLDDEGKAWLIDQAKKGGSSQFDGEVDWDNLTDAQQKDLYELNYNDEGKMADNEIMKGQEAYNGFRQKELDRKIKEAEDNGYTVIAPVGNSHVDMRRQRNKKAGATPTSPNTSSPSAPTSAPKLTDKVKQKISTWTEKEKAFFDRNEGAPGSKERRSLGEALKAKAAGALKAIKKGVKHEVEEFKEAGKGVQNFFSGKPLSEHEKKAVKAVAFKVVTTAVFGAAFGGLSHGVAAFGKHVAMEFIPHIVGETILKGVGKAAVFADADGEAEMDANILKFTELISKGLEEMEISDEMMEEMVDSYNKKKEETPQKEMTEENLQLANELMLEMIYGFIDEAKGDTFTAIKKDTGKTSVFGSEEARDAAIKKGTHKKIKDVDKKSQTPTAKKLGAGDFRPTPDMKPAAQTPAKKGKKEPIDSTQSIAKQKEVSKALYGNGNGKLLQSSTTSQQALDNGYMEGASWVAPGNAGSNFNENMSNEGVKILEKYSDLDEETLARILYERTKNTKLGLQQKDVAIGSENKIGIPSDIENKEIYRNCVVVARSAKSKAARATMGADRATQEGKFGKNRTKQVFGGTKEDLAKCEQTIAKAKKIFIYDAETDFVYEMPKDVMLEWVKSSGGGENAADTATITLDENGNAIYDGWSDKKTLKDIQGNSTLVDDYTKSEERLGNLVSTGQIDEKTANKAKLLILKDKQSIKDIEAGLKDISIQQSTYFLNIKPKDLDKIGDDAAKSTETKKHFGNFKKSVDDVLSGKAKSGKKTNAIREGILPRNPKESDEAYLDRFNKLLAKKPKLSNGNYFKVMSSVGKAGMLSGDDRKVIERTANIEKTKYKKDGKALPSGLDTDSALSELRKKSLGIQTDTFKNLNKLTAKSSTGKIKKLGDLLAFDDAKGLLHLDKIDTPKNEKDFTQILRRNTQLAMEGIAVTPKIIKGCLGVGNTKELEDSFELSFVERYTYDKDNVRVTGKVVYVYAINKDGKKEEIAQKVYRPKQGPTAPTANTVTWSASMQKCFDSKK